MYFQEKDLSGRKNQLEIILGVMDRCQYLEWRSIRWKELFRSSNVPWVTPYGHRVFKTNDACQITSFSLRHSKQRVYRLFWLGSLLDGLSHSFAIHDGGFCSIHEIICCKRFIFNTSQKNWSIGNKYVFIQPIYSTAHVYAKCQAFL